MDGFFGAVAAAVLVFVVVYGALRLSGETYEVNEPTVVWSAATAFNSRGVEVREQCVVTSGKIGVIPSLVSLFGPTWEGEKVAPETKDGIRGCQPGEELEWDAEMRGRFPVGQDK